jgi:hypothetical protein
MLLRSMGGSALPKPWRCNRQAGLTILKPGAHPGVLDLLADLHDARQQQRVFRSHALPSAARLQPARPLQLQQAGVFVSALQAGGNNNLPHSTSLGTDCQ